MLLSNPFLTAEGILNELEKLDRLNEQRKMELNAIKAEYNKILSPLDKKSQAYYEYRIRHNQVIDPLQIIQSKLKSLYFFDKDISAINALEKLKNPAFDVFPRLKHVLQQVFSGEANFELSESLQDWKPTATFEQLNIKYGYFNDDLSPLFQQLAVACQKMTSLIERQANDDEMAYKLMALFYDPNKNIDDNFEQISQKFGNVIDKNQNTILTTPYHDAFVTILNNFPLYSEVKNFESWKAFIMKEGFTSLEIFSQCARSQPAFKDIKETQDFLLHQTYPRANENPKLAKLCKKMLIYNDGFEAGLVEIESGWPKKKSDNLPIVDISDETGNFFWVKLPPEDMRALYLGNLIPGCCQFINGHSSQCVKDGISLSNNGFYVLLKGKKQGLISPRIINHEINDKDYQVVAQSYAWITNNGNMCLDSIEWNQQRVTPMIIQELMQKFSTQVFTISPNIKYINVGDGGQTPRDIFPSTEFSESMKEGSQYGDSSQQLRIASNINHAIEHELKKRLASLPNELQHAFLYIAPYFSDIAQLPQALLNINPNIPVELPKLLRRCYLPPTLTPQDFKTLSFSEYETMDKSQRAEVSTVCKMLNAQTEKQILQWLPTIPKEEVRFISRENLDIDTSTTIIENLSNAQQINAVIEKKTDGSSLLYQAIEHPKTLQKLINIVPPEQRQNAILEKYFSCCSIISQSIRYPESLQILIDTFPPKRRSKIVLEKYFSEFTLLNQSLAQVKSLKIILESIPPEQRTKAILEKNSKGESVLFQAIKYPESFKMLLEIIPEKERLAAVKEKEPGGIMLLDLIARNHPTLLQEVLALLPPEQLIENIVNKKLNILTTSIIYNHESLKIILKILPPNQLQDVILSKDDLNRTELFYAARHPQQLMSLLNKIPQELLPSAIIEQDGEGQSTLFKAARNKDSLNMLLERLNPEQRLEAILAKDVNEESVLDLVIKDSTLLNCLLDHLPEPISNAINARKQELENHEDDAFESILSLHRFIQKVVPLSTPEVIYSFINAIVKNEEIDDALTKLLQPKLSHSLFQPHPEVEINKHISELHIFWKERISRSNGPHKHPSLNI